MFMCLPLSLPCSVSLSPLCLYACCLSLSPSRIAFRAALSSSPRVESCAATRLFVALINEVVPGPSPVPGRGAVPTITATKTRVNRLHLATLHSSTDSTSSGPSPAPSPACLVWIYVKLSARPPARGGWGYGRSKAGGVGGRRRFKLFNQIEFKWFPVFRRT